MDVNEAFNRKKLQYILSGAAVGAIILLAIALPLVLTSTNNNSDLVSPPLSPTDSPSQDPSPIPAGINTRSKAKITWKQIGQNITASSIAYDGYFGDLHLGVALSANGQVVAAAFTTNKSLDGNNVTESVQVYTLDNTTQNWVPKGNTITGSGFQAGISFPLALSSDGNILAIGEPNHGNFDRGRVRVFQFNDNSGDWQQMGAELVRLTTTDYTKDYSFPGSAFGSSLALSADGMTMAVGAPSYSVKVTGNYKFGAGAVTVFRYNGSSWQRHWFLEEGQQQLDWFGSSVALSENGYTLVASTATGYLSVIDREFQSWGPTFFNFVCGETPSTSRRLASPIAMSGNGSTLVIGANTANNNKGCISVFRALDQDDYFRGDLTGDTDHQGKGAGVALSSDGTVLAETSTFGVATVYGWNGIAWRKIGSNFTNASQETSPSLAYPVALSKDGTTLAVASVEIQSDSKSLSVIHVFRASQQDQS